QDGAAANGADGTAGAVGFATAVGLGCTGSGPGVVFATAGHGGSAGPPAPSSESPAFPRRCASFLFQRRCPSREPVHPHGWANRRSETDRHKAEAALRRVRPVGSTRKKEAGPEGP